jgi:Phage integrase central domain
MRHTMTDRGVAQLRSRAARYAVSDPELRGHWIRIQPSGAKSFWTVTRNPEGKQIWSLVGPADAMGIEAARMQARSMLQRVRSGLPAVEPRAESFGAVVENWLKRHVEANGLRSAKEIRRLLAAHILPSWRDREFVSIRRSDVAAMLDEVEDGHSARQADAVLSITRAVMNWFATRHDDYVPPVVKGMHRRSAHAQARARVLGDDEVRQVWLAAESNGTFGAIVRICLLTAQRSRKVAAMRWDDGNSTQACARCPRRFHERSDRSSRVCLGVVHRWTTESKKRIKPEGHRLEASHHCAAREEDDQVLRLSGIRQFGTPR